MNLRHEKQKEQQFQRLRLERSDRLLVKEVRNVRIVDSALRIYLVKDIQGRR